jgi:hypothetical protein
MQEALLDERTAVHHITQLDAKGAARLEGEAWHRYTTEKAAVRLATGLSTTSPVTPWAATSTASTRCPHLTILSSKSAVQGSPLQTRTKTYAKWGQNKGITALKDPSMEYYDRALANSTKLVACAQELLQRAIPIVFFTGYEENEQHASGRGATLSATLWKVLQEPETCSRCMDSVAKSNWSAVES